MKFETKVIHAGQAPDPRTGAVMTPIYATSTYAQSSPGEHKGYDYARTRNPTRDALEACLAELEGGHSAFGARAARLRRARGGDGRPLRRQLPDPRARA
jgi:cystathionine gamma-lyase